VTLVTRLTWSPHIDQVRKRAAQRMGILGHLLNRKNDLSVRNGPAIEAAHPSHNGLCVPRVGFLCPHPCPKSTGVKIKVFSPGYWFPWYVSNRQIHGDLGVLLFADQSKN